MPAYDFLSGVASAVEKQSNALQAYGLQKREQEREQQERTQYNQVFTELGQFLASGQEIPEERIQTWTSMMGAAPPEIVTAFTNAMNTLGQRRTQASQFEVTRGISEEQNRISRERLRIDQSQFAENIRQKVLDRDRLISEGAAERTSREKIAGMSAAGNAAAAKNYEYQRLVAERDRYAGLGDNRRAAEVQKRIDNFLGLHFEEQAASSTFTPSIAADYITQAKNNLGLRANPYTTRSELERMARAEQDPTKRSHIRLSINEIPLPDTSNPASTSITSTWGTSNVDIETLQRQRTNLSNEFNRLGNPFSKNARALKRAIDDIEEQLNISIPRRAEEKAAMRSAQEDSATAAYIEAVKNR